MVALVRDMSRFLNTLNQYVGKSIGEWTILNNSFIKKGCHYKVECKCSCGKIKYIDFHCLLNAQTMSCGHIRNEKAGEYITSWIKNNPHPLKKQNGEAAFNMLWRRYTKNAKEKNLQFNLTINEFKNITQQHCYYCNKPPIQNVKHKNLTNGNYSHNGIDRKNNMLGYILENCVACCTECNYFKKDKDHETFLALIEKIHNNIKVKQIGKIEKS